MKLVVMGDAHLKKANPRNRIDNFYDAQFKKYEQCYAYAQDNNCAGLIQVGDLFDSSSCPYEVVERYMRFHTSQTLPIPMFIIMGQHDQRYHKGSTENTPFGCFLAGTEAFGVSILTGNPKIITEPYSKTKVALYGASWGDEIPEIQDESAYNILVIHKMITKGGPLWEGQKNNVEALDLLKQTKFRMIASGDNHKTFTETYRMRHLVNCGSLMRMSIDQVEHQPCFYVYDTEGNSIKKHLLKVEKPEDVFSLDKFVEQKQGKQELDQFIKTLVDVGSRSVSFKDNIHDEIATGSYSEEVKSVLTEIIEGL